jgi:hypothetical protein
MKILLKIIVAISAFGITFGQIPSYVPTNGLVGWWGFNGNADDGSVYSNNGTPQGALLTNDRFNSPNQAYILNNLNDLIVTSGSSPVSELNANNQFTISLWFQIPTQFNNSSLYLFNNGIKTQNGFFIVIDQNDGAYGKNKYMLAVNIGGKISTNYFTVQDEVKNWTNVIGTYDGIKLSIYINSKLKNTASKSVSFICPNTIFQFADWDNPTTPIVFKRKIDDIGVWNRVLSQQEIDQTYDALKGLNTIVSNKTDVSCNGGTDGSASIEVSGGIPPYFYNWNTVPPQTTKTATGLKAGKYEVSVSDSVGTLDTIIVTISEPSPVIKPIIVGDAIICLDYPISTFTVDSKLGYRITWNTPKNGRIIGSNSRDSVVVEWQNSGIDTVYARYTDAQTGCYEETKKAVLVGNPLTPSIQGSASTCIDTVPVTYRTRFQAGQSYGWSKPRLGTIIGAINLDSVQIEWNASGQDTLTLREFTIATGCFKDTSLIITINPRPQPSISGKSELVEYSQSNVYSVSNESGSSYEWSIVEGDAEIEKKNGNSIELKAGKSGIVIIKIIQTTSDGCKNEAQYTITVKSATGITESRSKSFSVYPNPNNGQEELIIELPSTSLHKMRIELIDLLGITRYEGMIPSQTSRHVIQLSDMPKGMYTIRLITRDGVLSEKVIVE